MPAAEFGRLAALLTSNAAVARAFKDVEADVMRDWAATTHLERDKREAYYHDLVAVRRLHEKLKALWTTTKHEAMRRDRVANQVA